MTMLELKVGDVLSVCASIDIFCGTTPMYLAYNIGISKYPDACSITIGDPLHSCLSHFGIEIAFTFKNYGTVLKSLGMATTYNNGVAGINYTITEEDAALFNNNPGFKIAACFTAVGSNYPNPTSSSYCKSTSSLLIRGTYIGNACIQKQGGAICLLDKTLIVYENPIYTAGKITGACVFRVGSSSELPDGKIKVFRLTGTTWSLVGESGFLPIQNYGVTTFTGLNIIAQKGDYIGLYVRPSSTHGYDACIDAVGGVGLLYAKTHIGDVVGSTNDSEWTNLDSYRVAISATILPCVGVTCPDACIGYDLYHQTCNYAQGCIPDASPWQPNSPTCGYVAPGQEEHRIYFRVSTLLPTWFVMPQLPLVYNAAVVAIDNFATYYYVKSVDFNPNTYIMTIIIGNIPGLGSNTYITPYSNIPYSDVTNNVRIESMILPVVIVALFIEAIPYIAMAIAIILVWFAIIFLGSESVAGAPPSTRIIRITPTTSAREIIRPTFPITVEYNFGETAHSLEITDGLPHTFEAPTNMDIVVTVKAKDNPYYKITKRIVKQCSPESTDPCAKICAPECEIVAVFTPVADATLNPGAIDSQRNPITCGFYDIYEEDSSGNLTLIKRQTLGADGKVDPTKVVADVHQCVYIVPCDLTTYRPEMKCYKVPAGQTESGDITVNKCIETKNQISVRTVYIAGDGSRIPFTAESIDIKLGGTPVATQVPTSDITLIKGFEKNTTYSVFITKSGYTPINNGATVSFGNTDCDIKDIIMESSPPIGSYDITVEVRSSATASVINGATVTLDTKAPQTTGVAGTTLFAAIPVGSHHIKVVYNGYETKELDHNVTISETITVSIDIEQVYADTDTRIANFKPSTIMYANSTVKFQGDLQFLEGTSWKPLREATINISVKKGITEIKTFTVVTSSGFFNPGYFETTDWLIPTDLADQDISVHAEFAGVGKYRPSSYPGTYHIGSECAIRNPLTGECIISPMAGYGFMVLAGLGLLAAVMLLRPGGAAQVITERIPLPAPKEAIKG